MKRILRILTSCMGRGPSESGSRQRLSLMAIMFAFMTPLYAAEELQPAIYYELRRPGCDECRSYSLKIFPKGRVIFEGTVAYFLLPPSMSKTVERGVRETNLPEGTVELWVDNLTREGFFSLEGRYAGGTCAPDARSEQTMTVRANDMSRTIGWDGGCAMGGPPPGIQKIVLDIRKQVNPDQWMKILPSPYRNKGGSMSGQSNQRR